MARALMRDGWDLSGSAATPRFDSFSVRYVGATNELDAINADLLIVEASTDLSAADDALRPAAEVAQLTDDAATVYAYMSIGAIDTKRAYADPALFSGAVNANSVVVDGVPDAVDGAVWLQFWAPDLRPLFTDWARDLATQGYDGAFLDVVDSWNRPSVLASAPGDTDGAKKFFVIDAMMRVVLDIAAAGEAVNPSFEVMLGHTPLLLKDYFTAAAAIGATPDAALVAQFKAEIDAILIEGPDVLNQNPLAVEAAQQDWGDNTALLALGYFPGAYEGDADATAAARDFLLAAGLAGGQQPGDAFGAYAAPTDRRAFDTTYPLHQSAYGAVSITSHRGADVAMVRVAENRTNVDVVSATGASAIGYKIIGGADGDAFLLDSVTGALSFRTAPDAERPADADHNNIYEVTVRAADDTGGADAQAVLVRVIDVGGVNQEGTRRADVLDGTDEQDELSGRGGNDTLSGFAGADQLWGDAGGDTLIGGADNDSLDGGDGSDVLTGGAGADRFVFGRGDNASDRITDFEQGADKIDLSDLLWKGARGGLIGSDAVFTAPGQFRVVHVLDATGDHTLVEINANRGALPEYTITLDGYLDLTAADFILGPG